MLQKPPWREWNIELADTVIYPEWKAFYNKLLELASILRITADFKNYNWKLQHLDSRWNKCDIITASHIKICVFIDSTHSFMFAVPMWKQCQQWLTDAAIMAYIKLCHDNVKNKSVPYALVKCCSEDTAADFFHVMYLQRVKLISNSSFISSPETN